MKAPAQKCVYSVHEINPKAKLISFVQACHSGLMGTGNELLTVTNAKDHPWQNETWLFCKYEKEFRVWQETVSSALELPNV